MSVMDIPVPARADGAPVLTCEHKGAVALVTLNDPGTRNSLSEAMIDALHQTITRLGEDKGTQAIVLAANGPVFCAGHNLKEMTARRSDSDRGRAYFEDLLERCAAMMMAIVYSPAPVIAAIDGIATAAGCQLVASCDLAVAGASSQFCTPGVHLGLFCSTPMVALSRKVSRKRALEMLLLGEMVSAEDAAGYGLINRVVPDGEAIAQATEMAEIIASKSPATVSIGKRAFYKQVEMPLEEAYKYASEVMVKNMLMNDAVEGMDAFMRKRTPQWRGN